MSFVFTSRVSFVCRYAQMLEKLGEEIETFTPSSLDDVAGLALKVDIALDPLCDEVLVLKHFPEWPQPKLDTIRELAGRIGEVRHMQSMLDVKRSAASDAFPSRPAPSNESSFLLSPSKTTPHPESDARPPPAAPAPSPPAG